MRVDVLLRGIFFHRASNYVHYSPDAIILILDATGRVIKVYLVEVKAPYALRYILEKFDNEAGSTTWYQGPIRFPVYGYHALPGGVSWEVIGGRPLSPIDVSLAPLPLPHFAQAQLGMAVGRARRRSLTQTPHSPSAVECTRGVHRQCNRPCKGPCRSSGCRASCTR